MSGNARDAAFLRRGKARRVAATPAPDRSLSPVGLMAGFRQILVCATPGRDAEGAVRCGEKGGSALLDLFRREVEGRGLDPDVVVQRNPCSRRHSEGPVVFVFPDDRWYTEVRPEDVPEIVSRHLG